MTDQPMHALEVFSILNAIDRFEPGADPTTWTIDGEPITASQLETLRSASADDKQVVHDLVRLMGAEIGYEVCPHCRARDNQGA